ncbi:murein transglycosylase A [Sphingomonas mesophila]|uniref:murein transglycosylase A n=1 Tax=Sphingomonas mesophila TaxID=2303576 RepID=UPI001F0862BE|nr:MltA domain-containing protein [Sphingomonas mesophila]
MSPRLRVALAAALILSACVSRPPAPPPPVPQPQPAPQPTPTPAPTPTYRTAAEAGVTLAAPQAIDSAAAERALAAFRLSCPELTRREDRSGLTIRGDWDALCAEAAMVAPGTATAFFRDRFDWVRVADGKAFATGYYEPQIRGSRVRAPGFEVPVYAKPASLVRCTRADGTTGRGRIDPAGQCVAHFSRAEIEDGALAAETPIAWAADPIDLFFLQIQGSGRLLLPDGGVIRIGYADQNGHSYIAIGRVLRDRGILQPGKAGMKEIVAWMRAQPDGGRALMRENPSYIFFRELTGPGPLGAMGLPVTPRTTVATDPLFVPLGGPAWLDMAHDVADGLWVAQDTGGAIKGANRFDTFWGAGDAAEITAGGLSSEGRALILLPKGAAARLAASGAAARR